jgi:hypothetical protein
MVRGVLVNFTLPEPSPLGNAVVLPTISAVILICWSIHAHQIIILTIDHQRRAKMDTIFIIIFFSIFLKNRVMIIDNNYMLLNTKILIVKINVININSIISRDLYKNKLTNV